MACVHGDIQHLAARLGRKPISSAANVTLLKAYDQEVFGGLQELDRCSVLTAVLFLDLMSYPKRGREAAVMLREGVNRRIWEADAIIQKG